MAKVTGLQVHSSLGTCDIEVTRKWTGLRADVDDLPEDMYIALKDWLDARTR